MNTAATLLLENLGRTTLALALAGIVALLVLRLVRSQWPTAHRAAWLLVLFVGWTFLRLPVAVPWYEAEVMAPAIVELALPPESIASPQVIELAPEVPPLDILAEAAAPPPQSPPAVSIPTTLQPTIVPAVQKTLPNQPWYQAIDWPTVVVSAWILGMSLCAAAWLVGYLRFVRLLRNRQPADDASAAAWRELLSAAGVKQFIPLSVSHQFGPMLCCLPRGYELIVPADLWSELDAAGQGAILRHELAHYQRGDVWKSLAARVLALPHWFNPIAWLAVRRFEEAAEWACDRAAVADQSATEYAKLLVHLGQTPHALGYGSSAHGRTLAARVRRVLKGDEQKDSTLKKVSLLLVGLLIAGVSVVQLELVAQEPGANESVVPAETPEPPKDEEPPTDTAPGSAKGFEVFKSLRPDEQPIPPEKQTLEALQKRILLEANRAYEAHLAAFDAQTVAMPTVYEWSLRWMTAAEALAKNKDERIAAARGHVERMSALQKRAHLLYQIGTKGGEAAQDAAATYYLGEAEKHLAQVEAESAPVKFESPAQPTDREMQTVDLEIKLAELRGELEQTAIQIKTAESRLSGYRRILAEKSNALSGSEVTNAQGEVERLKIQQDTLKQQIKLHERKLALVKQQPQPAEPPKPKSEEMLPFQDEERPELRYANRTFNVWLHTLREDLDPASRAEAIRALATFANHGYGRQAAEAIVDVFKQYKVVPIDNSTPMGQMRDIALKGFLYYNDGSISSIPKEDALPVILQALRSDSANQRLFGVVVLPNLMDDTKTLSQLLAERLKDADADVQRQAALQLAIKAPDTPGLLEVMRQWLSPTLNQQQSQQAVFTLYQAPKSMQLELAPEVVRLLDRDMEGMGGPGSQAFLTSAGTLLRSLGADAIPALEEGVKSDNKTVREKSQKLLDELRSKKTEEQPKTETPAK